MDQQDQGILTTLTIVMGALVAIAVFVGVVAFSIGGRVSPEDVAFEKIRTDLRIRPVGQVARAGDPMPAGESAAAAPATAAATGPKTGADIVAASCASCHNAGVLGAPKIGDGAGWKARMGNGVDGLVANAISGMGQMPAKGGNASLSDEDIRKAVVAMLADSGIGAAADAAPAASAESPAPAVAAPAAAIVAPVSSSAPAAPAANTDAGKGTYFQACAACHGSGIAGAPKIGDVGAWAPRIAQGAGTLLDHAVKGFQGNTGFMPPKGGAMHLPDSAIADAIAYMVANSQ